jgi:hypothetical protein
MARKTNMNILLRFFLEKYLQLHSVWKISASDVYTAIYSQLIILVELEEDDSIYKYIYIRPRLEGVLSITLFNWNFIAIVIL